MNKYKALILLLSEVTGVSKRLVEESLHIRKINSLDDFNLRLNDLTLRIEKGELYK